MGEVVDITSGKPVIEFSDFLKVIKSPQTKEEVDSEFFNLMPYNVTAVGPRVTRAISREPAEEKYGLLQPMPPSAHTAEKRARSRSAVLTNEKFPEFIEKFGIDDKGNKLERETALKLAASSLVAYQSLLRWNKGLPGFIKERRRSALKRSDMLPRHPHFWTKESYDDRSETRFVNSHTALHRIAARVALNSVNIEELDYSTQAPYPPHITALADPFTDSEVKAIHVITKQRIKQ